MSKRIHSKPLNVSYNEEKTVATIEIEGVIGVPEWLEQWFSEVDNPDATSTKEKLKADLKAIQSIGTEVETIRVLINSPGGMVDHALSMFDLLVNHPANVETLVGGMTASAATLIAQAASKGNRYISENAFYLPHCARGGAWGTKSDVKAYADMLVKLDDRLATIYAQHSGRSIEDHLAEMSAANEEGEWLTAKEAITKGYADELQPSVTLPAAAMAHFGVDTLRAAGIRRAPAGYLNSGPIGEPISKIQAQLHKLGATVSDLVKRASATAKQNTPPAKPTAMTKEQLPALFGALNLDQIEMDSEQGAYLNKDQLTALNQALVDADRSAEEERQKSVVAQNKLAEGVQAIEAIAAEHKLEFGADPDEPEMPATAIGAIAAELTRLSALPGAQHERGEDTDTDPEPPAAPAPWESDDAPYNLGLANELKHTAKKPD